MGHAFIRDHRSLAGQVLPHLLAGRRNDLGTEASTDDPALDLLGRSALDLYLISGRPQRRARHLQLRVELLRSLVAVQHDPANRNDHSILPRAVLPNREDFRPDLTAAQAEPERTLVEGHRLSAHRCGRAQQQGSENVQLCTHSCSS